MKAPFAIKDKSDPKVDCKITGEVEIDDNGISIRFNGYGTKTERGGQPIYIEYWNGHLRAVVWKDINLGYLPGGPIVIRNLTFANPLIISLEAALEDERCD